MKGGREGGMTSILPPSILPPPILSPPILPASMGVACFVFRISGFGFRVSVFGFRPGWAASGFKEEADLNEWAASQLLLLKSTPTESVHSKISKSQIGSLHF